MAQSPRAVGRRPRRADRPQPPAHHPQHGRPRPDRRQRRQRRRRHHHLVRHRLALRVQPDLAARGDHAGAGHRPGDERPRRRRHGTRACRPHPRELQPAADGARDPRHRDRQLRHHGGRVLRRGGGVQPVPRTLLRGRAGHRRGRVVPGHARLVPQGGARAAGPGLRAVTYVIAGIMAGPDWGEALKGATRPASSGTACGCSPSSPPSARR